MLGTTTIAALQLLRNVIAVEVNDDFVDAIQSRINSTNFAKDDVTQTSTSLSTASERMVYQPPVQGTLKFLILSTFIHICF